MSPSVLVFVLRSDEKREGPKSHGGRDLMTLGLSSFFQFKNFSILFATASAEKKTRRNFFSVYLGLLKE